MEFTSNAFAMFTQTLWFGIYGFLTWRKLERELHEKKKEMTLVLEEVPSPHSNLSDESLRMLYPNEVQ